MTNFLDEKKMELKSNISKKKKNQARFQLGFSLKIKVPQLGTAQNLKIALVKVENSSSNSSLVGNRL